MRKLSHEEIGRKRHDADTLLGLNRLPCVVVLDNIRSLYNVGSIFRTSDGARVSKLYLGGFTPSPPRKEIEKTALGATKTVPYEHHRDSREIIRRIKSAGMRICLLEHTDRSIPYHQVTRKDFPMCLVVGNELTGVSEDYINAATMAIDIPMYGMKQSLNVAVAYGIVIFHFAQLLGLEREGAGL